MLIFVETLLKMNGSTFHDENQLFLYSINFNYIDIRVYSTFSNANALLI